MTWTFRLVLFSSLLSISCDSDLRKSVSNKAIYQDVVSLVEQQYVFSEKIDTDWKRTLAAIETQYTSIDTEFKLYLAIDEIVKFLKDGHTNLYSPFELSRSWDWFLNFPPLKDNALLLTQYKQKYGPLYINSRYWITGGFSHFVIVQDGFKVGYIEYTSFSNSASQLRFIMNLMKSIDVKHFILDLRNNGGGALRNALDLMGQLVSRPSKTYRIVSKSGSVKNTIHVQPSIKADQERPFIILTNRSAYSATNFFAGLSKEYSHLKLLGDRTGGGAGLAKARYLNNGWVFRLSTTKIVDTKGHSWETGVEPDILRNSAKEFEKHRTQGKDYLIEEAFNHFKNNP